MLMKNVYYIAGLLEGEGCFGIYNNCPSITICMTDKDTIELAKNIIDIKDNNTIKYTVRELPRKPMYSLNVSGNVAIQWMMTLYSLMSSRRKSKIREILNAWKNHNLKIQIDKDILLIRDLMRAGLTEREANLKLKEIKGLT